MTTVYTFVTPSSSYRTFPSPQKVVLWLCPVNTHPVPPPAVTITLSCLSICSPVLNLHTMDSYRACCFVFGLFHLDVYPCGCCTYQDLILFFFLILLFIPFSELVYPFSCYWMSCFQFLITMNKASVSFVEQVFMKIYILFS